MLQHSGHVKLWLAPQQSWQQQLPLWYSPLHEAIEGDRGYSMNSMDSQIWTLQDGEVSFTSQLPSASKKGASGTNWIWQTGTRGILQNIVQMKWNHSYCTKNILCLKPVCKWLVPPNEQKLLLYIKSGLWRQIHIKLYG